MVAPSSIPLLFLISIYLDNDWNTQQETVLLEFLSNILNGETETLGPCSLYQFSQLINFTFEIYKHQENNSILNLGNFLMEQISKICESRYSLEEFLKQVSGLIKDSPTKSPDLELDHLGLGHDEKNVSPSSLFGLFIRSCLLDFESMSFEQAGLFYKSVCLFCTASDDIIAVEYDLAERFIDSQIRLLEQSSGAPVPSAVQATLLRLETHASSLNKRHFLEYLNRLRLGDLSHALTSIRKYFDYTIKDPKISTVQYSALSLAALYTKLGYPDKALSAVRVGMLYARDENDQECLSFLLCWFHELTFSITRPFKVDGRISEGLLLESMAVRTLSQQQYSLCVLCELRRARFLAEVGASISEVEKAISKAKEMRLKFGIQRQDSTILLAETKIYWLYGEIDKSVRAAKDIVRLKTEKTRAIEVADAMSELAMHMASTGAYKDAMRILADAEDLFPVKYCSESSRAWVFSLGTVRIDRALYHGDHAACLRLIQRWLLIYSADALACLDLLVKKAKCLGLLGRVTEACQLLHSIIAQTDPRSLYVYYRVQAQIALVDIHSLPGTVQGAVLSLSTIMSAISLSKKFHFQLLYHQANARCAILDLYLGNTVKSLRIIKESLDFLLIQGSCSESANALYIMALSLLAQDESELELEQVIYHLKVAIKKYEEIEYFGEIIKVETLLAQVYNLRGSHGLMTECFENIKEIEATKQSEIF